jgi:putative PIN family toxin of toxin-antitoxin system
VRRVVVDPGVLVSAILTPLGPPAEIVRAVRTGHLALVVCSHLLAELLGVLQREKFRAYLTIEEAEQYVAGLASTAETHPDPPPGTPISRDPNDDYLIALALETAADRSSAAMRTSSLSSELPYRFSAHAWSKNSRASRPERWSACQPHHARAGQPPYGRGVGRQD